MCVKNRPFPPCTSHRAVIVLPWQPPVKKYFLSNRFLHFHKKHLHRFCVVHIEEFSFSNIIKKITKVMATQWNWPPHIYTRPVVCWPWLWEGRMDGNASRFVMFRPNSDGRLLNQTIRAVWYVVIMERMETTHSYSILVYKSRMKRILRIPRH